MARVAGRTLLLFILMALAAPGIAAELRHAYLSTNGSDSNPCTREQPCRYLPAALAVVAEKGEIWMLDSGAYNVAPGIQITKAVTISGVAGASAKLLASATRPAIIVDTGDNTRVTLKHLIITTGLPSLTPKPSVTPIAADGIVLQRGRLILIGMQIYGLPGHGVKASGHLHVSNSIFRANGGYGIVVEAQAWWYLASVVMLDGLLVEGTGQGGISLTNARGTLTNSLVQGGVIVQSTLPYWDWEGFRNSTLIDISNCTLTRANVALSVRTETDQAIAEAVLTKSLVSRNGTGIQVADKNGGVALVILDGNSVTHNGVGVHKLDGGTAMSRGNNLIIRNDVNLDGNLTTIASPNQ